jgi:hypothetical protein
MPHIAFFAARIGPKSPPCSDVHNVSQAVSENACRNIPAFVGSDRSEPSICTRAGISELTTVPLAQRDEVSS